MSGQPRVYSARKGATPPPPGAIYVGRRTRNGYPDTPWGNPFILGPRGAHDPEALRRVLAKHWDHAVARALGDPGWLAPLRGHDLVCWCLDPEQTPSVAALIADPAAVGCHAVHLLHLANLTPLEECLPGASTAQLRAFLALQLGAAAGETIEIACPPNPFHET